MEIKVVKLGAIAVNCYLISTEKSAIVIDPGYESNVTEKFLKQNEDKERLILLTHAHFDHISGALSLKTKTGVKIAIGEKENFALSDESYNLANLFGANIKPFSADILLEDNCELNVGDLTFKVLHTPGHTVGSVSYLAEDVLFSGDTLFYMSVGRTDFPGGDFSVLRKSIDRLFELDGETTVLSGHGEATTIAFEKQNNPFL